MPSRAAAGQFSIVGFSQRQHVLSRPFGPLQGNERMVVHGTQSNEGSLVDKREESNPASYPAVNAVEEIDAEAKRNSIEQEAPERKHPRPIADHLLNRIANGFANMRNGFLEQLVFHHALPLSTAYVALFKVQMYWQIEAQDEARFVA